MKKNEVKYKVLTKLEFRKIMLKMHAWNKQI